MKRYLLSTLMLVFFPAFAQVNSPIETLKQDTSKLLRQIEQTHKENARIVDSIVAIIDRKDSIERSKEGVYIRVENVDHSDGRRQVWTWVYKITPNRFTGGVDTIFKRVYKRWTRWDR